MENRIGKEKKDYMGRPSTLCKGCGHDSITACIISAYYDLGVQPHETMKMSGIGCSSKTPTYFMEHSHGFNSVHGRMPSVATGANLANQSLYVIGISGDGDTASIGLGQYCHMIRRNVDSIYIIENNGTYGLTKGQFSATADKGSKSKKGVPNPYPVIDTCSLAIDLGATFVARSFSGDRKQLIALIKAAHSHKGTAIIDVISPCVTFNNHDGSTKSYTYFKEHGATANEVGYVPSFEEIQVEAEDGATIDVALHDGSTITLKKLDAGHDVTNATAAWSAIKQSHVDGHVLTGLLYVNPEPPDHNQVLNIVDRPLFDLKVDELDPGPDAIAKINASLK